MLGKFGGKMKLIFSLSVLPFQTFLSIRICLPKVFSRRQNCCKKIRKNYESVQYSIAECEVVEITSYFDTALRSALSDFQRYLFQNTLV